MTRDEAITLVNEWTKNKNLVRHMLAVEAVMRALAIRFGGNPDEWGLAGILHDADYEMFKDDAKKHPSKVISELEKRGEPSWLTDAIRAHAWGWREDLPEPKSPLEWSIYCCDELTGFIIACALVRPEKKLSAVTVEAIMKKWPAKAFAAGVVRENIAMCEPKLGIPLPEFAGIALTAMQGISGELGL